MGEHGLVRSGSGYGQKAGCHECGNESLGSVNYGPLASQVLCSIKLAINNCFLTVSRSFTD